MYPTYLKQNEDHMPYFKFYDYFSDMAKKYCKWRHHDCDITWGQFTDQIQNEDHI